MLPKAPYVFTICSGLNDVFITWFGDSMLSVGATLRTPTTTASAYTAMRCAAGIGCPGGPETGSHERNRSSSVVNASTIVSQFSHDRLPLTISVSWNTIVIRPAMPEKGGGRKYPNGMISSTT